MAESLTSPMGAQSSIHTSYASGPTKSRSSQMRRTRVSKPSRSRSSVAALSYTSESQVRRNAMTLSVIETTSQRKSTLRLIDCDVHQEFHSWEDLRPYLGPAWWERIGPKGPPFGRRAYENVRGHIISEDMINPATGKAADDPAWVKRELFEKHGVDLGILTSNILSLSSHPNVALASAVARAYNDWTLETWVRPHPEFKGSIIVNPQDPAFAVEEIERLADDPGVVQVLVFSG